jgi:DNA helicase-2/ATP-dependent DNA helicase PcrA
MPVLADDLNEQQRQAVEHLHGPLLVLAPVGTGKTTVIAHRAAAAIRAGMDPRHLLCLSFTNRAAREMRDRILALLGPRAGEVTVRTFHGFCTHVLRHEADALGIPADFTICDEEDAKYILRGLCRGQGVTAEAAELMGDALMKLVERMKLAPVGPTPSQIHDPRALLEALVEENEPSASDELHHVDPEQMLADFNATLAGSGALDFSDLILKVDRLFASHPERLARWQQHFPWLQVDEVQDTNLPEYHILAQLAWESRDLAFFGDIDQTIYEWRGSQPFRMLGEFERRFAPVRVIALVTNYRSSRTILQACESFIKKLPRAVTRMLVGGSEEPGKKVFVRAANTLDDEGRWIAAAIQTAVASHGLNRQKIAVLVRANHTARYLSDVLDREGVEHRHIKKRSFFRQPEVKDALAHVRCLLNRLDTHSLLRLLRRPPRGLEPAIEAVRALPPEAGLRLVDLIDPLTPQHLDPFGLLLSRFAEGRVVVFDVESTGLDVTRDDVVELAGLKVGACGPGESFHALLKTGRPLEESSRVHGITADVLGREGREPSAVFAEFLSFINGCALVGHNVGYDVNIVRGQLRRLGLSWPGMAVAYDTLDMCRRFFKLHNYTLANVCRELKLASPPSHRAMDDVRTTWQLLQRLVPCLLTGKALRERSVAELASGFDGVRRSLQAWHELLERERPGVVLKQILDDSGLRAFWGEQEEGKERQDHLRELEKVFSAKPFDDDALAPREAMLNAANLASLGNDLDRYVEGEDKVFLLTVHQAKGLEFDTVFIAGATDRQFPSARSVREGREDEEHRLFYVAMTRARRRLFITHHRRDGEDRPQTPSRFLASIPEGLRQDIDWGRDATETPRAT